VGTCEQTRAVVVMTIRDALECKSLHASIVLYDTFESVKIELPHAVWLVLQIIPGVLNTREIQYSGPGLQWTLHS